MVSVITMANIPTFLTVYNHFQGRAVINIDFFTTVQNPMNHRKIFNTRDTSNEYLTNAF